jgi:2-polyprenyl-6-methoxyphenol hydroxylase-like FAD-dependent oxidoreductase
MGVEVSVYERSQVISEVGAGLLLSPNAVSVLYALGLEEDLRVISMETPRWRVLDVHGRVLAEIKPATRGVPAISLRRADLQNLLLSHLRDGSVHLGREAKRIKPGKDFSEIEFAEGKTATAQVVVASDGIHSQLRDDFFQQTAKRQSHYIGWRAMVNFVPKGWEGGTVTETWGRGMRFGLASTGSNRCYWYASANRTAQEATAASERKTLLRNLFSGWHRPVLDVIEATSDQQILENEIAIEDAWQLAQCLKSARVIEDSLSNYGRRRRLRVQGVQWASRVVGLAIQTESFFLCSLRDNFVRFTPDAVAQASLYWLFNPCL